MKTREFGGFASLEEQPRAFDWMQDHLYRTTGYKTGAPPGPRNPEEGGRAPIPWDQRTKEEQAATPLRGMENPHPAFPIQHNLVARTAARPPTQTATQGSNTTQPQQQQHQTSPGAQ